MNAKARDGAGYVERYRQLQRSPLMKWKFEINNVICERLDDGRLKCGLCNCTFFAIKDLEAHLQTHFQAKPQRPLNE